MLALGLCWAHPDLATLRADWSKAQAIIHRTSPVPYSLHAADLAALAKGKVAKRRDKLEGSDRMLGAIWSPYSQAEIWVALQDDLHDNALDALTEARLPGSTPKDKLLYQRMEVPWPFKPRQWVLRVRNTAAAHAQSRGAVWDRTWVLLDPAKAAHLAVPDGVWTPQNEGGWGAIAAAGGTILVYHAKVDVAGAFPEDAGVTWAMLTLDGVLKHFVERAGTIRQHYTPGHKPIIFDPSGADILPGHW